MFRAIDPTTGQVIEEVAAATPRELEESVVAAAAASGRWARTAVDERARRVGVLGERLRARSVELAALAVREMGKPVAEAEAELAKCAWACDYYREEGPGHLEAERIATDARRSLVMHAPLGVVLAIMPWNFPFWQVIRFAAPTLLAGNVVVLKHAPSVPACARAIAEIMEEAGLGDGVFQNIWATDAQVSELIADRRVAGVTLTGSVRAGRAVAAAAGSALKPCVLELGGSDPLIVLRDADLQAAVAGAIVGRFQNCGQSCVAAKRTIVEAPLHDAFVAAFVAGASALRVGDPADRATQLGPMARDDLRRGLHDQVRRSVAAGASLALGGQLPGEAGFFYPATVLTECRPRMAAFDEETFGPLAAIVRAEGEEHALELAGDTSFGLGASVWLGDRDAHTLDRLAARLRVGHVAFNGIVKSDPRLPFGGVGDSGFGRELGRWGTQAFAAPRSVWIR